MFTVEALRPSQWLKMLPPPTGTSRSSRLRTRNCALSFAEFSGLSGKAAGPLWVPTLPSVMLSPLFCHGLLCLCSRVGSKHFSLAFVWVQLLWIKLSARSARCPLQTASPVASRSPRTTSSCAVRFMPNNVCSFAAYWHIMTDEAAYQLQIIIISMGKPGGGSRFFFFINK